MSVRVSVSMHVSTKAFQPEVVGQTPLALPVADDTVHSQFLLPLCSGLS